MIYLFWLSRLKFSTKVENESFGDEPGRAGEDSQQTKNQQEQHQQYLGDVSQGLPEFKPVQTTKLLPGMKNKCFYLCSFWPKFRSHFIGSMIRYDQSYMIGKKFIQNILTMQRLLLRQ